MSHHRVAILLLALALPAQCATLFVSKSGDGTTGQSWETAFATIGEAIVASTTGDEVWVKEGTYYEHLAIEKPLRLLGGFRGDEGAIDQRDVEAFPVTIRGDKSQEVMVVTASGETVIDGVSISNGASPGNLEGAGGITIKGASCTLQNVEVAFNGSPNYINCLGGGLSMEDSSVRVDSCYIHDNLACGGGGGLSSIRSFVLIRNTDISNNKAESGAGAAIVHSAITLSQCSINNNCALGSGGGIECFESKVYLHMTAITNNHVSTSAPNGPILIRTEGSGLRSVDSVLLISNCIVSNNFSAKDHFGSFYGVENKSFVNCTFKSVATNDGVVWDRLSTAPSFINCVMSGSENNIKDNPDYYREPFAKVSYSNIEGGYPGEGNIDADPKFVNAASGDFHLERGSPCIDSGTDTGLTTDFDGNPRPVGRYDMGAFEFPYLRSDINGDDRVDAMDLLILEEDWGLVSGP